MPVVMRLCAVQCSCERFSLDVKKRCKSAISKHDVPRFGAGKCDLFYPLIKVTFMTVAEMTGSSAAFRVMPRARQAVFG